MVDVFMAPTAGTLLAASVELIRTHLQWSHADLGAKLDKSRQWAYKLVTGRQSGTTIATLERLASVFSEGCGYVITPSDLFQPDRLKQILTNSGVAFSVTPSSNAGTPQGLPDVQQLRAAIDRLERSDAKVTAIFFDLYTLLARYIERGDSGTVRMPQAPVTKTSRSGKRARHPR